MALALLSVAVSAWSFKAHFEGGITQEFCQYAEIGRNILEHHGLRTRIVYPFTLAYFDENGILFDADHMAPVLERFPIQSYLTAASEAALGKTDAAIAALSAFLLAMCVVATCAVGWELFGPWEGILAGLFLALNPSFQRGFVLWGLPDFGFCILTLAAAFMACSRPIFSGPKTETAYWIASGAMAGLAWLARSNFMIWIPLFFWIIRYPSFGLGRRWAAYAIGIAAAASPSWYYNFKWYGSIAPPGFALNLLHHVVSDEYPLLAYHTFSIGNAIFDHSGALWHKFHVNLFNHLRDFPTLWQMQILFPCMLAGIYDFEQASETARRFVRLMLAMLIVHLIVFSALRYERLGAFVAGRYLIWWAPAAFCLSARGIVALGRRLGHSKMTAAALALANLAWFFPYLTAPQGASAHPSKFPVGQWPEIRAAAEAAGNGLVVTNLPAQMAWYGHQAAVGLPALPSDVMAIDRLHPVSAVLITRLRIGELDQTPAWRWLLDHPADFQVFQKKASLRQISDFGTAVLLIKK